MNSVITSVEFARTDVTRACMENCVIMMIKGFFLLLFWFVFLFFLIIFKFKFYLKIKKWYFWIFQRNKPFLTYGSILHLYNLMFSFKHDYFFKGGLIYITFPKYNEVLFFRVSLNQSVLLKWNFDTFNSDQTINTTKMVSCYYKYLNYFLRKSLFTHVKSKKKLKKMYI